MAWTGALGMKKIGILPGDPAGIGYEITAKALDDLWARGLDASCVVYADASLFRRALSLVGAGAAVYEVDDVRKVGSAGIYLLDVCAPVLDFEPGAILASCARCAYAALEACVRDVMRHEIGGICTGPIHKGAMRAAGVHEIGHTEMFAKAFGVSDPVTLFITRALRIFFYTRHLSLRDAIAALDESGIVEFGRSIARHMGTLGMAHPRLALAALNPHAGDGGQFGREEIEILEPAARRLRGLGIDISDPIGADSVFTLCAREKYDAVLSLYHDQGHIAAKTYDFERTISATLGLPVLRTSVDHGTAFDIAWQNRAQHISMKTAIDVLLRYMGRAL